MPKGYSGIFIIKFLMKHFDFVVDRQKGSHVVLKGFRYGKIETAVVPLHKELSHGTLRSILDMAKLEYSEFRKMME
ncbi:type II toxin-antitoxin system HicA family toxin [Candidatus Uhrbacteria bacterium]|nr:type II toxin-antitoxin system HicA family toxin [Candidatus Uhrbacteria bacterium]